MPDDEAATLGRRLILRCGPGDGIDLARQLGRSLATRGHSEMRAVRLLDGNRLITDVVNNCLPLNHHDTQGAPDKKPQRTGNGGEAAGVGEVT